MFVTFRIVGIISFLIFVMFTLQIVQLIGVFNLNLIDHNLCEILDNYALSL